MVVAHGRPELYDVRPGWGGGRRNSATLGLAAALDEDTARLVSLLLERSVMPARPRQLFSSAPVATRCTRSSSRACWARPGPLADDLPETVQALIAARLDTLAPELKSSAPGRSVLGKVSGRVRSSRWEDATREDVLAGPARSSSGASSSARRVSSMRDEEEFSFWHVLVRDVAY